MSRRAWSLALAGYLLVWIPFNFAAELMSTLPSLRMRGVAAVAELVAHGGVALLCATAGRMISAQPVAASRLAPLAIVASGVVSVQSLFWTVLPRNVAPGTRLPLVALTIATVAFWLFVVSRLGATGGGR